VRHYRDCTVPGCPNLAKATAYWCHTHYMRNRRHGTPGVDTPIRGVRSRRCIPIEPLLAVLEKTGHPVWRALPKGKQQVFYRSKRAGYLTLWAADDIACALGLHPIDIWPDWYVLTDRKETA
jgi:lambda repressor-like predicted transcriptional regulator